MANLVITELAIEALFGRYDYRLPLQSEGDTETPCVSLFYGDNGTGKTTILETIFHLLSAHPSKGHKSFVAKTPFRKFDVQFSDQTRVVASRDGNSLTGDFRLSVSSHGTAPQSEIITVDPDSGAVTPTSMSEDAKALLENLANLGVDVFYLGDSRDLETDAIPSRRNMNVGEQLSLFDISSERVPTDSMSFPREHSPLEQSIQRLDRLLRRQAMLESSAGETSAQESYADILRTIASTTPREGGVPDEEIRNLEHGLRDLEYLSKRFATFGLASVIEADPLTESLAEANETSLPMVVQVLRSFMNSQIQRLIALNGTYENILSLIDTTNAYLTDKKIAFDLYDGFAVKLPGGLSNESLDPNSLSSGEKHLLLIFLNILNVRDRPQLFLIDEPELSLNIKWQRRLVDSLLDLSKDSRCQFLLATHSIELLTKHRRNVVEVKPHGR